MEFNYALLTDFYELTMAQGYFLHNHNPQVVFEMFFRKAPFGSGFSVFAGLETFLKGLEKLKFSEKDLEFLAKQKIFRREFLKALASFRFSGDVYAPDEGRLVFPNEPLIRVNASLIEAQLIESFLLNSINFQTLIATKAARVYLASGEGTVLEFGLRRAHGPNGALLAGRAAYIGGAAATSNTLAGKLFGIPVKGTMAHSWIMAFDTEEEAFRRYADIYPDGCILLIDTYDTLESGLVNAMEIGKNLKNKGHKNFGVRLDSGDCESLSKEVRKRLDRAGLKDAKIAVSNELDENIICQLLSRGAPIDIWGVGTNMVTARGDPSLSGVYKLIARQTDTGWKPVIKVSDDPEKTSNPGIKQIYRFYGHDSAPLADLLTLENESVQSGEPYNLKEYEKIEPLVSLKMRKGKIVDPRPDLKTIQNRVRKDLHCLKHSYKRIINPHIYKVSLSKALKELKAELIDLYNQRNQRS